MEVVNVVVGLYKAIDVINSAIKFHATMTQECDSEKFHYEVRKTHCWPRLGYLYSKFNGTDSKYILRKTLK